MPQKPRATYVIKKILFIKVALTEFIYMLSSLSVTNQLHYYVLCVSALCFFLFPENHSYYQLDFETTLRKI